MTLSIDSGLEFCSGEFSRFCSQNAIMRHRTCTDTPQQNGVAERMNRTLINKVRCMLNESGLPKQFWVEVTHTANYLVNRSPTSTIEFQTPTEKWSGHPPNLTHLKPFGCIAYAHRSQGKLDPRASKAVFIGYPVGVKGYKFWLVDEKKCIVSMHVMFNELVFYKSHIQKPSDSLLVDESQFKVEILNLKFQLKMKQTTRLLLEMKQLILTILLKVKMMLMMTLPLIMITLEIWEM